MTEHTIRPMRRTHRDHDHRTDCTLGARCRRRHSFYVDCSCGWYDWRGGRQYVEREIQTHLSAAEPKSAAA